MFQCFIKQHKLLIHCFIVKFSCSENCNFICKHKMYTKCKQVLTENIQKLIKFIDQMHNRQMKVKNYYHSQSTIIKHNHSLDFYTDGFVVVSKIMFKVRL